MDRNRDSCIPDLIVHVDVLFAGGGGGGGGDSGAADTGRSAGLRGQSG